jgi:prepilin-type N-terminal cleavage/methylation domain-containing protein
MRPGEKGFTLLELVIGLGIMTLAVAAAGGGIYQTITNTGRNSNHMASVLQVQNAGYRIGQDVQMSQNIATVEELSDPDFLFLSWIDAISGDRYEVTYAFQDMDTGSMKKLMRMQSINDTDNQTSLVASDIDYTGEMTTCNYTDGIFSLKITSVIGNGPATSRESRIYRIFPRPG